MKISWAAQIITYPNQSYSDQYPIKLLELALNKSPKIAEFILAEAKVEVHQGRALKLLRKRSEFDVAWSMTSIEREKGLRAIKIPIYKGLFGYRIFLIANNQQNRFPKTLPLETLKHQRIAVQGNDWPDIKVLRHHGFDVQGIEIYESLFHMLKKKRADYFPRSMLEAWREADNYRDINIAVEQNLAIFYPAFVFFFLHPHNQTIGDAIEEGLLISIKDGSFDELFNSVAGNAILQTQLSQRRIIRLSNPNVSSDEVYQWSSFVE